MSQQLNSFKETYASDELFVKGQEMAQKSIGDTYFVDWHQIEKFDAKIKELYNVFAISSTDGAKLDNTSMVHELENIAWMQMRFADPAQAYDGVIRYGMWMQDCYATEPNFWPYSNVSSRRSSLRSMLKGTDLWESIMELLKFE